MYKRVSEGDKYDGTNPWIMARIFFCVCQNQKDKREVKVYTWWREGMAKVIVVESAEMRTTERWLELIGQGVMDILNLAVMKKQLQYKYPVVICLLF